MASKLLAKNVKVLQTIRAHTSDVTCVEFWSNQLFTGSRYGNITSFFFTVVLALGACTWY